jgi:large subunit ribosomal protein L15
MSEKETNRQSPTTNRSKTMKLHNLTSIRKQHVQRIGRGGKRGTTSGRGQKGQKSRAGHRIRPAERDLILKIPKQRGFRNKPKKDAVTVFNVDYLTEKLKLYATNGTIVVTQELLKTANMLPRNFRGEVKVLGKGTASMPISIGEGVTASKSVQEKMKKK